MVNEPSVFELSRFYYIYIMTWRYTVQLPILMGWHLFWIILKRTSQLVPFSQSDYLIHVIDIKLHSLNHKQCRSRTAGFFRSQLIWIFTVCKGRVYSGSAGQGLNSIDRDIKHQISIIRSQNIYVFIKKYEKYLPVYMLLSCWSGSLPINRLTASLMTYPEL